MKQREEEGAGADALAPFLDSGRWTIDSGEKEYDRVTLSNRQLLA